LGGRYWSWCYRLRLRYRSHLGSRRRSLAMAQEIAQPEPVMLSTICLRSSSRLLANGALEWRRLCLLTCVLLSLVHLLLELLRLLLADKREPREALFELEGMKKSAVLVVIEWIVYFLVPYHASTRTLYSISRPSLCIDTHAYRYVDHFEPKCVSHQVIGQDCSPLETCIDPSLLIWVRNIEAGNSHSLDLVG
jgi:hypothetical protein